MRCPSCGTENTPDSRFCGGCGAKVSTSRVAPTVKLSDDAQFPVSIPPGAYSAPHQIPQTNPGRTPIHIPTPAPGVLNYGSIPPQNQRLPSVPPTNSGTVQQTHNPSQPPLQRTPSQPPQRTPSQPPQLAGSRRSAPMVSQASSPSMSMAAPPPRSSTWIAVIVILDLGLAGAGAMLLAKGLHKPTAAAKSTREQTPTPTPVAVTAPLVGSATRTAPVVEAGQSAAGAVEPAPVVAPPIVAGSNASGLVTTDHKHHKKGKPEVVTKPADSVNTAPSAELTNEVNAKASISSGVFQLCQTNAGDVHGRIQIQFEVDPNGHVTQVGAVENTTGSDPLASCLINTISGWTFPPHTGGKAVFVRPFEYD